MQALDNGQILLFLSTPSGWRATFFFYHPGRGFLFLSTPSGWRATSFSSHSSHGVAISIHALRVEGDEILPLTPLADDRNFYPRPPGGGRQIL